MVELRKFSYNFINRLVESSLGKFVDEKKAQLLKEKKLPLEGCAMVAGRTDKGVTALGQVCAFCMLQFCLCISVDMLNFMYICSMVYLG